MKENPLFMAFASGKDSNVAPIKRYIGVAPVAILDVNPNKTRLSQIYGTIIENEPGYVTEKNVDGKKITTARIDFIVRTDPDTSNGIDLITKISFFVSNEGFLSKNNKAQVIDKYGRTAWVTSEELKSHIIPTTSSGNLARIDKNYRLAYRGEAELVDFLKVFLNIPATEKYVDKMWIPKEGAELDECQAELTGIKNYFNGNFKELHDVIALQPNNKIKVLFGVKENDGAMYQDVFTRMFLRNTQNNYTRLEKEVINAIEGGAYPNTTFLVKPLEVYDPQPTNLSKPQGEAINAPTPFDDNAETKAKTEKEAGLAREAELPFGEVDDDMTSPFDD